jgi:nucleotide-binding universal stress UspA family protein
MIDSSSRPEEREHTLESARPSTQHIDAEALRSQLPPTPGAGHGIRHILVSLDGSPGSEVCLPYAIAVARIFGGSITLLHVMATPDRHSTDTLGWELSRREATAYLQHLEQEVAGASGQRVRVRLEQGHPAERITALAHELAADLTVLGSHGAGGTLAWKRGSTAQQVLAVAEGSVLIAPSERARPAVAAPMRILVPLDGSLRSESVLPTVARIAREHGSEVLLAHVVLEAMPSEVLRAQEDLDLARELTAHLESSATRYLTGLRQQVATEIASVRSIVVRSTDARQALLDLSAREGVDLIVLSAHGVVCNQTRPCGSVAAHLSTEAPVPILVLQDLTGSQEHPGIVEERAPPLRASYTELH